MTYKYKEAPALSVETVELRPRSGRDKICTIGELAAIVASLKSQGKIVVQAHGAFDLLHLGHIRHLEAARRTGDILIVTVTSDKFIKKGPGRPVFNEYLRAEMLAALEYVDWVGINPEPSAVTAIRTIRPNVYIKGQDYVNPEGDITGKITEERKAIEECGGKIDFTDEVTFSSSELINQHFNIFEPHIRDHLSSLQKESGLEQVLELIDRVRDFRVLVVGDAIIDEYRYVLPMGKSPKENMIATRYQDHELFAGGVFAAANHVASFCREVEILTCIGENDSYEELIRRNLKPNIRLTALTREAAPTTRKCRFIDPSYMRKLFEVYTMDDEPLFEELQNNFDRHVGERASEYDLVITTDFGHGLIAPSTIKALVTSSRFLAVNAQTNSANLGFNRITKYPAADYICIDAPEARLAVGDRTRSLGDIVSKQLSVLIDCSKFIITQGQHGCVTFEKGEPVHTIPALTKTVVDTVGAGDAFLAVTGPLVAAGGAMNHVGFIGNVVGALKVSIVGHRESVDKASLTKALVALLK